MGQRGPALHLSELSRIMERVTCDITRRVGQMELRPDGDSGPEGEGCCQVQTTLKGAYHAQVALAGHYDFFSHLAENMMGGPPEPEDVADYAVEYFNMLCGHMVAEIYRATGAAAKFCCPQFGRWSGSEAVPCTANTRFHSPFGRLELGYDPLFSKREGEERVSNE